MNEKDIYFFFTFEEFVEHNHQLGNRVKRTDVRANSKAELN